MDARNNGTRLLMVLFLGTALLLGIPQGAVAKVIHVDDDSFGGDGSSWQLALPYLQDALLIAQKGDDIWVAGGTYEPDEFFYPTPGTGDRLASFTLKEGVAVLGGFEGWEKNEWERDVQANPTILSGDLLGNDGSNYQYYHENSVHVVSADSAVTSWALLDGFIVKGGYADNPFPGGSDDRCGGVCVAGTCKGVEIRNCTLTKNWANVGGGVGFIHDGSGSIIDCHILDNYSNFIGGGMICISTSPEVHACVIENNESKYEGGGVYIEDSESAPVFRGCEFRGNFAKQNGGGIAVLEAACCTLIDSTFLQNRSDSSGGAFAVQSGGSVEAVNCFFFGNQADLDGGVARAYGESGYGDELRMVNCVFSGNAANNGLGGAMYTANSADTTLINSTFSRNYASNGWGGGLFTSSYCTTTVANCIFWENSDSEGTDESAQIHVYNNGTLVIDHSCLQGWSGAYGGTGNHGMDPEFVDPDGPDDITGTEDDNMKIRVKSPCINAGDNNALPADEYDLDGDGNTGEPIPFDINGGQRVKEKVVEMGAYEVSKRIKMRLLNK